MELTFSFFAAILAALAGGGCSIMWERKDGDPRGWRVRVNISLDQEWLGC